MSASLVGSEMCIRDRRKGGRTPLPLRCSGPRPSPPGRGRSPPRRAARTPPRPAACAQPSPPASPWCGTA
eukprot:13223342-Alexandrium_andersonii.AAC.1